MAKVIRKERSYKENLRELAGGLLGGCATFELQTAAAAAAAAVKMWLKSARQRQLSVAI